MKRRLWTLLWLLGLAATITAGCSSSTATLETVAPQTAADQIAADSGTIILDIRTPEEYREGIIADAINIDFYATDFADQLDRLDKDASYVVYCRTGNRSGQAMDTFADLGFTQVTEIDGGIANWYAQGLPVALP